MRLYDIMKEEPGKQNVVEESQLPEIPGNEETAPAETAVVETPAAEEPKYKYTSWWKMPSYAKAEKEYQEQGKKQMEIAEKRAKRQRDLAIFGDLAKLGAQAYAKGGGVYKIDKFTPQTEIANEKLRKVRDNNAAQIMAYAERMRTAQQGDAANEQARMKAEYDYGVADAAAKAKAAKDERDYQHKVAKDEFDAKIAAQNAVSRRISANASADRASGGSEAKGGNRDWISEYWRHIHNYPEFAIYLTDEDGVPIEKDSKPVFNPYITEKQAESVVKRITEYATARNKKTGDSKKPTSPMNKKNNQGDGAY